MRSMNSWTGLKWLVILWDEKAREESRMKKLKEKIEKDYRRKQALGKKKPKLKPLVIEKRNI